MKTLEPNWQELDLRDSEYIRNLHTVFDTKLDTFANVSDAPYVTGHITLWDVLQKIKYNLAQGINLQMYLTPKYVNGKKNTVYDELKEELPAICYNASFNGYKSLKNTKAIHNLMFLDIDGFTSREEALAYKADIIKKYDWILACSLSLSKIGLHVIIMVDKIVDSRDYNSKYDYISKEYFNGGLDTNSKSLSRFTIIPYDHDIFINDNPIVLLIDSIISKSTSSTYINHNNILGNALSPSNPKSTSSVYIHSHSQHNNKKSTSSAGGGEVIYTTHTFSSPKTINDILSTAARDNGLIFKPVVNEELINDPNTPLFFPEGIDVIEINLFLYRNNSIPDGRRTRFIGAITTQMIYLNVVSVQQPIPDVRENMLRFIMWVNKKFCAPPLSYNEVLKSYNSNWKRYENNEIDFTKYYKLKRFFWSQNSTLKGNEKKSVSMTLHHKFNKEKRLVVLHEVIQQMATNGEKIIQQIVADEIKKKGIKGLGITTIKTYWKHFKPSVQAYKKGIGNKIKIIEPELKSVINKDEIKSVEIDVDVMNSQGIALENPEVPKKMENIDETSNSGFSLTKEQQSSIFNRIFLKILPEIGEPEKNRLYQAYKNKLEELTPDEQKILSMDINTIFDGDIFWKHGSLESKLFNLCIELNLTI